MGSPTKRRAHVYICLFLEARPMEMLDFLIRYDEKGHGPIMSSSPRPPFACMRRSFMACYPATDSNQGSERGQNVGLAKDTRVGAKTDSREPVEDTWQP